MLGSPLGTGDTEMSPRLQEPMEEREANTCMVNVKTCDKFNVRVAFGAKGNWLGLGVDMKESARRKNFLKEALHGWRKGGQWGDQQAGHMIGAQPEAGSRGSPGTTLRAQTGSSGGWGAFAGGVDRDKGEDRVYSSGESLWQPQGEQAQGHRRRQHQVVADIPIKDKDLNQDTDDGRDRRNL